MFQNLKIGKKLIISFVLIALISCISSMVALTLLRNADTKYSSALVDYGFSQGDIGLLMNTLSDNNMNILTIIATDDKALQADAQASIAANVEKINTYLTGVKDTLVTDTEIGYYNIAADNLPEFTEHATEVIALAQANRKEAAMDLYQGDAMEHMDIITEALSSLMECTQATGNELSGSLTRTANISVVVILILIVFSLGFSLFLAIVISRSVARPMSACSERLVLLSKGDLHSPVPEVRSQDETGILAGATADLVRALSRVISDMTQALGSMAEGNFNISHDREYSGDFAPLHTSTVQIIQALNEALGQISSSAAQVSTGADQVSAGAQSLSQGATEQASSVEELAATINDISRQIQDNAGDASTAREKAREVGGDMEQSELQMKELQAAMERINTSSTEIGKIIKTIEDIAFQTNILALNAAVEAARAGAAGKGFAVVADEVRSLANKSQEASKNTASLIDASLSAVKDGTSSASTTAEYLLKAVSGAEEMVKAVERISAATATQATAMNQLTEGVAQISSVVQSTSATSEESAATSEELSSQAQLLNDLVGHFQLKAQSAI